MKVFSFLLRSSGSLVAVAVLAGLVAGLSNTGLLALINVALTRTADVAPQLPWSIVGLCVLMLVSRVTSEMLLIRLSQKSIFSLRMRLCRRILSTPLRQLEELGAHRLLATLTEDVPVIANALMVIPLVCMHLAIVAGCLIYLGWLSLTVLLTVVAFLALGIVGYQFLLKRSLRYIRAGREESDALYKHMRSLIEGTKELKLHDQRREAFFSQVLEPSAIALRQKIVAGNSIYAIASSWGHLLIFVLIVLIIFAVPTITVVDTHILIAYTLVILYMMTPMEVILNLLPSFGRANVALQKTEVLGLSLLTPVPPQPVATSPALALSLDSLELKGVTHAYYREGEDDNFILGPVDLCLRSGELIFIVGGNGSGKTTLAKLLTGLYTPESGEIRLNEERISDENRNEYRQYFSVVFSDFYLFESLLGVEMAGLDAKAERYLTQLHLAHKVAVKDGILSTTELSQGQRKRLALLTAYLEDRPLYLFDEWAADQDPVFKEMFYLQLLPELKSRGKTVIVISHDDRYYYVADRIVKLDYGQISEDGYTSHLQRQPTEVPTAL
jgi:putative ATP-binding cassette transporter